MTLISHEEITIEQLKRFVDENDHSGALAHAATMFAPETKFLKIFRSIAKIRNAEGHMPSHLGEYQQHVRHQFKNHLREALRPELATAINQVI